MIHTTFCGIAHETAVFLQDKFLCDMPLWKLFVDVFRQKSDSGL